MFEDFLQSYSMFEQSGFEKPLLETLRLYDLLLGGALRNTDLASLSQKPVDLLAMIQKRKLGIPWEYILGKTYFMGHLFDCSPDTFIPTEETSVLVQAALEHIHKKELVTSDLVLIELCTGCGNIAVCLAMHSTHIKILASDISTTAVAIAKKNADTFNLQDRISFYSGDLFSPFQAMGYAGKVDFVVCNPPYIPTASLSKLSPEIIDHEPRVALDGGPFGIDLYRRLINDSQFMLKPEGMLFFEIGERQETLASWLLEKNGGYENIQYYTDDGKIRAIRTTKKRL
jgi:release factor glutamine methyltransferase